MLYQFSKWQPQRRNTTSGFVFYDVSLPKVNVYTQTKFHRHILVNGWDIVTSGLEKQTSAKLQFYFRFRFRSSRHVIVHQSICQI